MTKGQGMKIRSLLALTCVCGLLLAFAASALAATPAQNAYGGPCASSKALCEPTALPFTGINAGLVFGLGASLLAVGFVVRRSIRTTNH